MNKKAFELAISTIILLVLGILLLIAIILAVTGGFDRFKTTINPLLETAEGSAIRQSCQIACQENNRFNFCCTSRQINNEDIKCSDSRLEINCNFNCDNFQCENQQNSKPKKCNWRPTKNYGDCEALVGAYFNGEICVYLGGCPNLAGEEIPFRSTFELDALTSCITTCQ